MDILQDIKNIVKNDKEHMVKVEVAWDGVTVYLDYDPSKEFHEDYVIPIHYCTVDEFAYIPDDRFKELYKPCDYGMDLNEITLMKEIMEYLESHRTEIAELCHGYDWEFRKDELEKNKIETSEDKE